MSRRPAPRRASGGRDLPLSRRVAIMAASAATTLGLLLLAVIAAGLWMYFGPGPASPGGAGSTTVILRQGAHLPEIATTLERGHAVSSAAVFMAAAQITGAARHLKAGEYEFPSRASMASVID